MKKLTFFILFLILSTTLVSAVYLYKEKIPENINSDVSSIDIIDSNDYSQVKMNSLIIKNNKITDSSSYIVDNITLISSESVSVECFKGNKWIEQKSKSSESYSAIESKKKELGKSYSIGGLSYTVTYTYKSDSPIKISILYNNNDKNTDKNQCRLKWEISGLPSLEGEGKDYLLFDNRKYSIKLNFSDVIQNFGDITTYDISRNLDNTNKITFYFDIQSFSSFVLDPSITVATSYTLGSTYYPSTFPNGNHHIVRTSTGTLYMVFPIDVSTSTDGTNVYESTDFGETWTFITKIRDRNDFYSNDVQILSNNTIIIANTGYQDSESNQGSSDYLYTHTSNDGFRTYTNASFTSGKTLPYNYISTYLDGSDQLHACALNSKNFNIEYLNWAGGNWSLNMTMGNSTATWMTCNILVASNKEIYIAANDGGLLETVNSLYLFNSSDSGLHFTSTNLTGKYAQTKGSMSLIEWNNAVYIFFTKYDLGSYWVSIANKTLGGRTWTVDSLQDENDITPSVIEANNHIYVLDEGITTNRESIFLYQANASTVYKNGNSVKSLGTTFYSDNLVVPSIGNSRFPSFNNASNIIRFMYYDVELRTILFDTFTITNTTPFFRNISVSSSMITSNISPIVTAQYLSESRNNATVTIVWFVNGTNVVNDSKTVTNSQIFNFSLNTSYFLKNEFVNASIIAVDLAGTFSSTNYTSTITINDTTPVINSLSVTPIYPNTNDTLNCSINATDFDLDSLTYSFSWSKRNIDGSYSIIVNQTNQTIQYDNLILSNIYLCSASVYDGLINTSIVNSSNVVTISDFNSPNITLIQESSSSTYSDSNIAFTVICSDSDSLVTIVTANFTKPDLSITEYTLLNTGINTFTLIYTDVTTTGIYTVDGFTCKDSSGNVNYNSTILSFSSSIRPPEGSPAGGATVRIIYVTNITNVTNIKLLSSAQTTYYDILLAENQRKAYKINVYNLDINNHTYNLSCVGDLCSNVKFSSIKSYVSSKGITQDELYVDTKGLKQGDRKVFSIVAKDNQGGKPSVLDFYLTVSPLGNTFEYGSKFLTLYNFGIIAIPRILVYLITGLLCGFFPVLVIPKEKRVLRITLFMIAFILGFIVPSLIDDMIIQLIF